MKLVFPIIVLIGDSAVSDSIEETITVEEYAALSDCCKTGVPIRQCRALSGLCSRIEETAVYRCSLYESDSIDNMDSFQVEIMIPDGISA